MKKKTFRLFFSTVLLTTSIYSFAQKQVISDISGFKALLSSSANATLRSPDSSIKEIKLPDGRIFNFVINKIENTATITSYYGVLQAPLQGGVFIYEEGGVFKGDITQSDINKTTQFQTEGNQVFLTDIDISKVLCDNRTSEKPTGESLQEIELPKRTAATDTRKLQSYPGAKAVVYIDFDGGWSGQRWANSYNSGKQFYLTPANISSDNELTVWKIMSEDYKPFNINITTDSTVFLQYPTNRRQRIIVTRNAAWQTLSTTGIAWIGGLATGDEPCFSFPGGFSSTNPMAGNKAELLGEVSSHEIGHTTGLSHDGNSTTSYYSGHGNWAPLMGSGYYRNVTQWSKGEYANANQLQDDLAIITNTTNGFGYKTDDYGNTNVTAQTLTIATGGTVNATENTGIIEQSTDVDVFKFTTTGGAITLHFGTATPKPNLDIKASLYNSNNQLLASSDIANLTYADISTSVTAGTYYISIEGVGYADPLSTGYSKYGSLGYYEISGTIPFNQPPTITLTSPTTGASFTSPAAVNITATATDSDGSISKVEFYQGTTLLNTLNAAPFTYKWTNVETGTYSITAKAYDNSTGTTTSSAVSITVKASNVAPTITITSPTTGATFTSPAAVNITATATDSDGSISKVEFYQGATLLNTLNAAPFTYKWTNVETGTYSITAKAYDNSTGITTSAPVSITVTTTTGINDNYTITELRLYPNPTTGIINFSEAVKLVQVYDLSGKNQGLLELDSQNQTNLSSYASGVYLLKMYSETDSKFAKVVKE